MFWNPVKQTDADQTKADRRIILSIAIRQLEKEVATNKKKSEKTSEALRGKDYSNSTKRAIATARNNAMAARKSLDDAERRLALALQEFNN